MTENIIQKEINAIEALHVPATNGEYYHQLKLMLESMESDVIKSGRGNKAASTRLRKSLRLLKSASGEFVKFTLGKL